MNIYITGLGSGYEVEHLVRLFYPMAPLTPVSYTHLTLPTICSV